MRGQTADVGVLIPTYNCARYVGQAIESVLNQTLPVREILVIDDGSTDNTAEIVRPYLKYAPVSYISKQNGGQAHTRKYGVERISSRYVAFLDADDLWEPQKIEKQMQVLDKPHTHLCFTEVAGIDDDGNPVVFEHVKAQTLRRGKVLDYLFVNNFVPHSSLVVERAYLMKIGSFDETIRMGDDWDIVLRLSTCCSFDYVPERLIRYRIRGNQLSKNFDLRIADQDRIINKFLREYPQYASRQLIRKGNAFRARNRGYHYASIHAARALGYYRQAIVNEPANMLNYKGIARTLVFWGVRKSKIRKINNLLQVE